MLNDDIALATGSGRGGVSPGCQNPSMGQNRNSKKFIPGVVSFIGDNPKLKMAIGFARICILSPT